MLRVQCPDDDAGLVFTACAARTRDVDLRTALLAQRPYIEVRAALYVEYAKLSTLFEMKAENADGIEAAKLGDLYGRVLVKGGERDRYLKLRGGSRFNRCPSCAQRDVKTLDHYLSKDKYPELAVFPANLVPCCFECNHAKHNYLAEKSNAQLFHPYFDDWSKYRLVRAKINVSARVTTTFMIRKAEGVESEIVERASNHFQTLALNELYEQHAAIELVERKPVFQDVFRADGEDGLRDELAFEAQSRERKNINSWQSALYRALSRSKDFCSGGFEQIDE